MDPAILALDEPSAGLDPEARWSLIDLLSSLPQTMIIASHDLDLVRRLCTRVIVLERGRIVADTSPEELPKESMTAGRPVLWGAAV